MTGTLRNKPAGCCCCECFLDSNIPWDWEAIAGKWDSANNAPGRTYDDDAILASNRIVTGPQILMVSAYPQIYIDPDLSDAYESVLRVGFRNAGGDQVYVERTESAGYHYEVVYEHLFGEARTVLHAGRSFIGDPGWWPAVLYDPDYDRFTVFCNTGGNPIGLCYKSVTTVALDRAFIGTGTLEHDTYETWTRCAFTLTLGHYNCICHNCRGLTGTINDRDETKWADLGGINLGPSEIELTVVDAAGTYADKVNCDVVTVYEPLAHTKVGSPTSPLSGLGAWKCWWFHQTGYGTPFFGYARRYVFFEYTATTTSVFVIIEIIQSSTRQAMAKWQRDIAGRFDARTLDLSGADVLTAADLVSSTFGATDLDDCELALVASP